MNPIEERLWSYIDGSCSDDERKAISLLIAQDEVYRLKYNELLNFDQELLNMELDEPPMAFTYNVMEAIRTEYAKKPLKATIDKRIINSIAAFFVLSILALVIYAVATANWSAGSSSLTMPSAINLTQIKHYFTGPVIKAFLFFDIILGLFLFDAYLRRKHVSKQL